MNYSVRHSNILRLKASMQCVTRVLDIFVCIKSLEIRIPNESRCCCPRMIGLHLHFFPSDCSQLDRRFTLSSEWCNKVGIWSRHKNDDDFCPLASAMFLRLAKLKFISYVSATNDKLLLWWTENDKKYVLTPSLEPLHSANELVTARNEEP